MADDFFFSEREGGVPPQVGDELEEAAWGGIVALIRSRVGTHSFALSFPTNCEDAGRGIIATDENAFWLALTAAVPGAPSPFAARLIPDTPVAMDVLEFAWRHVARATESSYHGFYEHRHLDFNQDAGRTDLIGEVNLIFRRSGLALAMDSSGRAGRLPPPVIRHRIARRLPSTGRASLDDRLERAIERYQSPDLTERAEALEKLWDAWEELKTLRGPKAVGISTLIGEVAEDSAYADVLDKDARSLTNIGNEFQIRHSEVGQVDLEASSQIDYFFGRLFNMIWLLLTALDEDV